jgi:hypothetical protein
VHKTQKRGWRGSSKQDAMRRLAQIHANKPKAIASAKLLPVGLRDAGRYEVLPQPGPDRVLRLQFRALARAWKRKVELLSSPEEMFDLPEYQGIVRLGTSVVPLLMKELYREPHFWFSALREITGSNPVPEDHYGTGCNGGANPDYSGSGQAGRGRRTCCEMNSNSRLRDSRERHIASCPAKTVDSTASRGLLATKRSIGGRKQAQTSTGRRRFPERLTIVLSSRRLPHSAILRALTETS